MFVLQYFYRKIKWIFWNSLFWKVLNLSKLKWNSLKHVVHVKNSTLIPESNVFKAWDKIPPLQCGILSQDRNAFLYLLLQRFTLGQRFATPLSVRGGFLFCFFFTLQLYLTCGLSFYLLVYFSFIGTISLLIMTDGKALCVCVCRFLQKSLSLTLCVLRFVNRSGSVFMMTEPLQYQTSENHRKSRSSYKINMRKRDGMSVS